MKTIFTILFGVLIAGLVICAAIAQEPEKNEPDQNVQREELFNRAAKALEEGSVSAKSLLELRAQLVDVRDRNAAIVQKGDVRANALSAQLNSLGPPPEGQEEAKDIAKRRSVLRNALAEANAPVREANEVQTHAEVLIREVDRQLRAQQFGMVLERFPSPLAPSTWVSGLHEIRDFQKRLDRDVNSQLARPSVSKNLDETWPLALMLLIFGLLLLVVLQHPVNRRMRRFADRPSSGGKALAFAVVYNSSFVLMPAIGAISLALVFQVLDIYPNSVNTMITVIPVMALIMIIANWLGHTLFSPAVNRWRLLSLTDREAKLGLRMCQGLGVFLVLETVLEALRRDNAFGEAAISVLSAPLLALAAIQLWFLSGVIRAREEPDNSQYQEILEDEDELEEAAVKTQESGFLLFLSLLMKASAVLAVSVTLVGYVKLARAVIIPTIMTVALLGSGFLIYHLALLIVKTATKRQDDEPAPIFFTIGLICVLTLIFMPLIALTWGARSTDIAEVWRLFTEGVQLGDIRLSLDSFVVLVVVFGIGVVVTRWLQNLLKSAVLPQTKMDPGAQTALVTGTGYVGLTLAVLIAVSTAGLNLSSLAVVAGALSVGIGFGLQTIVSNFVSGIILLIERPIKEGDWIEVSGQSGYVRKISVRSTRIETFDRHDVIIPNSDLIAGTVTNMTLTNKLGRLVLPVSVAYGSDLERVKSILIDAARSDHTIARYPAPYVLFTGIGEGALKFELMCYLKDINNILTTRSDLYSTVYNELGKAGVEIPLPQRDLHVRDIDKLVAAIGRRSNDPN